MLSREDLERTTIVGSKMDLVVFFPLGLFRSQRRGFE
jgi:hypothetical protein